jgi:hypothetical protein
MLVDAKLGGVLQSSVPPMSGSKVGCAAFNTLITKGRAMSEVATERALGFSETGIFGLAAAVSASENLSAVGKEAIDIPADVSSQLPWQVLNKQVFFSVEVEPPVNPPAAQQDFSDVANNDILRKGIAGQASASTLYGEVALKLSQEPIKKGSPLRTRTIFSIGSAKAGVEIAHNKIVSIRLTEDSGRLQVSFQSDAISVEECRQLLGQCVAISSKFGVTIDRIRVKNLDGWIVAESSGGIYGFGTHNVRYGGNSPKRLWPRVSIASSNHSNTVDVSGSIKADG